MKAGELLENSDLAAKARLVPSAFPCGNGGEVAVGCCPTCGGRRRSDRDFGEKLGGRSPRLLALVVELPDVAGVVSPGALRVAVSATARRGGISGEHAEGKTEVVVGGEGRGDKM